MLALAGPPGAGKSTLMDEMQRRHAGSRLVHYDKHQPLTKLDPKEVQAWFARGGDPNEVDHGELVVDLRREISRAANESLVLFETPFGRLHRDSGAFIDFLVWIDTPLDVALSRAMLASTKTALSENGSQALRGFVEWQSQYLAHYPAARRMYQAQRERIAPGADLVLDGADSPSAWATAIEDALGAQKAR